MKGKEKQMVDTFADPFLRIGENIRQGKYEPTLAFPSYKESTPEATEARKAWREERNRLTKQFKTELLAAYGVSGPKADMAYNIAWDQRHSSGLLEVLQYFDLLFPLIV